LAQPEVGLLGAPDDNVRSHAGAWERDENNSLSS